MQCTHTLHVVSHECAHACIHMVGGSCLAQVHHNPGLCLPITADPLPGQAWKEVTFSKVCLNRNDMWMCWHEMPLSALYHRISCSCQKSSRGCFLSPSFLFSFLLPPCEMQPGARENRISVCFNGCSIPQVYPDLKIPVKWGASLTTGMMLMLIWVCYCFFCLRSSLCHLSLNSFSTD